MQKIKIWTTKQEEEYEINEFMNFQAPVMDPTR